MDFYCDKSGSVFRPGFAVEELRRFPGFTYTRPYLVERFRETPGGESVRVDARHTDSGRMESFEARRLILAAGAMGTARVVLRSLDHYDSALPIVANPYVYFPCINAAMLGKAAMDRRHSLTQLGLILSCQGTAGTDSTPRPTPIGCCSSSSS